MISYIKDYGITNPNYEYLLNNLKTDIIETLTLSQDSIKKVLAYYNLIGIEDDLTQILLYRIDLIITPVEVLEGIVKKIGKDVFVNIIKSNIDDLVILGV